MANYANKSLVFHVALFQKSQRELSCFHSKEANYFASLKRKKNERKKEQKQASMKERKKQSLFLVFRSVFISCLLSGFLSVFFSLVLCFSSFLSGNPNNPKFKDIMKKERTALHQHFSFSTFHI